MKRLHEFFTEGFLTEGELIRYSVKKLPLCFLSIEIRTPIEVENEQGKIITASRVYETEIVCLPLTTKL